MPALRRAAVAAALLTVVGPATAQSSLNTVEIGYVRALFNDSSGDLTGPPGTTPPGLTVQIDDVSTVGLVYSRRISGPWSLTFQVGAPSTIKFIGAGAGASLGEAASAKGASPALLAGYTFDDVPVVKPYVAAGFNYTWFSDEKASASYTSAFFGSSSSASFKSSFGPVAKVGFEVPLAEGWLLDFSYAYYWIKTTATLTTVTPGLGPIARQIDVTANPGALSLNLGYRF
jgi:outer membrane protein